MDHGGSQGNGANGQKLEPPAGSWSSQVAGDPGRAGKTLLALGRGSHCERGEDGSLVVVAIVKVRLLRACAASERLDADPKTRRS